jgi:hypothetical protein
MTLLQAMEKINLIYLHRKSLSFTTRYFDLSIRHLAGVRSGGQKNIVLLQKRNLIALAKTSLTPPKDLKASFFS